MALACPEAAGRTVYDPGGCLYCANRGYTGRMAIFELLPSEESMSREIAQGCDEAQIMGRMRERGVSTLIEDAAEKVFAGETTVRDVLATVAIW